MGTTPPALTLPEKAQAQCTIGRELISLGKALLETRQDVPGIRAARDDAFGLYERLAELLKTPTAGQDG